MSELDKTIEFLRQQTLNFNTQKKKQLYEFLQQSNFEDLSSIDVNNFFFIEPKSSKKASIPSFTKQDMPTNNNVEGNETTSETKEKTPIRTKNLGKRKVTSRNRGELSPFSSFNALQLSQIKSSLCNLLEKEDLSTSNDAEDESESESDFEDSDYITSEEEEVVDEEEDVDKKDHKLDIDKDYDQFQSNFQDSKGSMSSLEFIDDSLIPSSQSVNETPVNNPKSNINHKIEENNKNEINNDNRKNSINSSINNRRKYQPGKLVITPLAEMETSTNSSIEFIESDGDDNDHSIANTRNDRSSSTPAKHITPNSNKPIEKIELTPLVQMNVSNSLYYIDTSGNNNKNESSSVPISNQLPANNQPKEIEKSNQQNIKVNNNYQSNNKSSNNKVNHLSKTVTTKYTPNKTDVKPKFLIKKSMGVDNKNLNKNDHDDDLEFDDSGDHSLSSKKFPSIKPPSAAISPIKTTQSLGGVTRSTTSPAKEGIVPKKGGVAVPRSESLDAPYRASPRAKESGKTKLITSRAGPVRNQPKEVVDTSFDDLEFEDDS